MSTTYNVQITGRAEQDTLDIWNFISDDNLKKATDFILKIETEIKKLEKYPQRCPVIHESEYFGIVYRHLLVGDYRIIFRIESDNVYIMRVIHGTRMLNL